VIPSPDEPNESKFKEAILSAWQICDSFDTKTAIDRGRILTSIWARREHREEYKVKTWLLDLEITETQAQRYMDLAANAGELFDSGKVREADIDRFTPKAFQELVEAQPEVQIIIADQIPTEDARVDRDTVKTLANDWDAQTYEVLPENVRKAASANQIPKGLLGPLVKNLRKIPLEHLF